jgi:hypothetical protein
MSRGTNLRNDQSLMNDRARFERGATKRFVEGLKSSAKIKEIDAELATKKPAVKP